MLFRMLLFVCLILPIDGSDTILEKLRVELEKSKTVKEDPVFPYLCKILSSQEFIKAADDEDLLSSILYELGFGVLGIKPNSWAAKFRDKHQKPVSCFSALYSIATTEVTRSTLASSRRILARCCSSGKDL